MCCCIRGVDGDIVAWFVRVVVRIPRIRERAAVEPVVAGAGLGCATVVEPQRCIEGCGSERATCLERITDLDSLNVTDTRCRTDARRSDAEGIASLRGPSSIGRPAANHCIQRAVVVEEP